ncbi:lipase family protein [Dyadobacter luticola]|uniref:Lipase family protein n=1 Tax=Dyadobacter luticola TaxID=1979387 RepID=A0A5R9KYH2_9BACT|nr:lipase family protein [Dyadobacter luticola]TLV01221.1 lipase family protein [Dyadobacter luticola]
MQKIATCLRFLFLANILYPQTLLAQNHKLKPGFDKAEYIELMQMHVLLYDSTMTGASIPKFEIPKPAHYKSLYASPVMGLDNRWELWKNDQSVAVINVRGTTKNPVGWLENFYTAMVPARGELKLSNTFTFKYDLASHPKAGVHLGWLIGTAYLATDIVPRIDSLYKTGIKDFLIMGHSQGGGIGFLLTAHLYSLQKQGLLPKDIRFKTYCSAGPKVGNTYFAYEYEHIVDGGWAYNVVNSADWVPEVPFTVQTLDDFNETNPFKNMDKVIGKQKLLTRIALKHAYKKMKNPSMKAQRNYEKYLGDFAYKIVKKSLPEYVKPAYLKSSNYMRTGPSVMLWADSEYYKKFPDSDVNPFAHHAPQQYLYLMEKYQPSF